MELSKKRMLDIAEALEFRSKNAEIKCGKCGTTLMQYSKEEVAFYERVVELLKANQEGKLKILPCMVGDHVWRLIDGKIYESRIQGISICSNGFIALHFGGYPAQGAFAGAIGKTVFLTKEKAEEALANGV